VKDDEHLPNNNTAFMDYEGAASPKSIEKINYYRKLNVRAMEKRMKLLSQGPETPKEQKI